MTRAEAKQLNETLTERIGGKGSHPFIGTWLDRPGLSLEVRLTTVADGKRVVVHKWDDEDTCSVRFITGNFWRRPDKAVEYGRDDDVPFTADAIVAAAQTLAGQDAAADKVVASWVHKGGSKVTVESFGRGGYGYTAPGSGGVLHADDDEGAIAQVQALIDRGLFSRDSWTTSYRREG